MAARGLEKLGTRQGLPAAARGVLLLLVLAAALTLSACTGLFFHPGRTFVNDPATMQHAPEDVYFLSADKTRLHGWYFRARGTERGTILICHGNVENISTHVLLDLWLIDAGYNLFIFDYRGYGRSEGSPDVKGVNLDAEAALETVLARTPGRVIVFGKSLGGAIAVYMVAHSPLKDRVSAVVVDSAFSSYRLIAREKVAGSIIGWPLQYPLSYLVNNDYSPVDSIRSISPIPVLIMQGEQDTIVPEHHSRMLFDAAGEPRELWELNIPGHVVSHAEGIRQRLLDYLSHLPGSASITKSSILLPGQNP